MRPAAPSPHLDHRYRRETGGCPIELTLDVIGGRWKSLLLYHLWEGTKRFHELRKLVPHVSQGMLVRQLRELERDQLIIRNVTVGSLLQVEYTLTPLAERLGPTLRDLRDWGEEYLEQTRPGHHPQNADQATPSGP